MTDLVLGCGFTGARVVRLLAARGGRVLATCLRPEEERAATEAGGVPIPADADVASSREALSRRCAGEGPLRAVLALPPARLPGGDERIAAVLRALHAQLARVVLISSTAVYGDAAFVDAGTPPAPTGERGRLWLDAEEAVRGGPWASLVLRAAGIYGPGRGLLAEDGPRFTHARSLDAVVSRIHADDLAAIVAAGLDAALTGAYPVADEEPASGRTLLAAWSETAWSPRPGAPDPAGSRRVDGSAIVRALGVKLRYASFRAALG